MEITNIDIELIIERPHQLRFSPEEVVHLRLNLGSRIYLKRLQNICTKKYTVAKILKLIISEYRCYSHLAIFFILVFLGASAPASAEVAFGTGLESVCWCSLRGSWFP